MTKYTSLDTEKAVSQSEKGEGDYLLDEDLVKPVPVSLYHSWRSKIDKPHMRPLRCLCKTLIVLVVLFTILAVTFAIGSFVWVRHQVRRVTVPGDKNMPQPPLPVAPIPAAQLEVVKDEAKLFWDQLRADMEPTHDFVITQEQLNGLIASSDYLRGHAFVTLTENEWHTDLVLPAKKLPGGRGRYFMGETVAKMEQHDDNNEQGMTHVTTQITPKYHIRGLDYPTILNGQFLAFLASDASSTVPVVNVEYGQFLNWVAPQDWIDQKENILDCNRVDKHDDDFDRRDCQELMSVLGRLESISLEDGKIVFKPRRTAGGEQRRQLASATETHQESERASKSVKPGRFLRRHQLVRRALKGMF